MKIAKILLGVIVAAGTISCGNSELESRITKLEGKVAALEGKGGVARANPTAQPIAVNNPTPATPATPAEKPDGPLPTITFDESLHDFGTIKDGDVVEHVFTFTNNGQAPLLISDAKATCGCTVPEWPRTPIAIGETGEIKVRFNSKNRPGIQNKTVTLTANTWPATQRVQIKANVVKEGQ